jgi:hypothetical protein
VAFFSLFERRKLRSHRQLKMFSSRPFVTRHEHSVETLQYAALESCPVSVLKLTITWNGAGLDWVWTLDFPLTLTSLSIGGPNAPQSRVLSYLARHPLLKILTIGSSLGPPDTYLWDLPTPRLANLVVLHRTAFVHFPLLPDTLSLPCTRAPHDASRQPLEVGFSSLT